MPNGNDRLDRIERILEDVASRQREMTVRQQYHDEAFERQDAEIKSLRESIERLNRVVEIDAENIRSLARIAKAHE